ncbi:MULTISPECIES: hypothetical protein [Streptomyces]|uniref:hypothetical protein n=1 Tax=Streptomyces TaxID=1883 RepID=UPI000ADBFA74|nr:MULTISPECIES: hypothetical protein [Streptomyces]
MNALAVSILEDATGLGSDLKTFMQVTVLGILYVALVISVGIATRSVLKTGVAALGGAIFLGIVAAQSVLSDKTKEEFERDHSARPAVVRIADAPGVDGRPGGHGSPA